MRALCLYGNILNFPLMFVQLYIDSLDFACNSREIQGKIPASEMPRLQDVLATSEGEFSYVVRGMCDKAGRPMLEVTLDGWCQLLCQRCLQSLAYPVKLASHLMLVSADQLDQAEDESEDHDSIPANKHMGVLTLLEEELLLSLPFSPSHSPGICRSAIDGEGVEEIEREVKTPFAVLAKLKNKPN